MSDQDDVPAVECEACGDTGWRPRLCGGTDRLCGRRRCHAAHDYVTPCECRPINRNYQERLTNGRRVA